MTEKKKINKISKECGVPKEVIIAIGYDKEKIKNFISAARRHRNKVFGLKHELRDENHKKEAIESIVGENIADEIHLSSMGQVNSSRIAAYLASLI